MSLGENALSTEIDDADKAVFIEKVSKAQEGKSKKSTTSSSKKVGHKKVTKKILAGKTNAEWKKLNDKLKTLQQRWYNLTGSLAQNDPFYLLGAYPKITKKYFNSYPDGKPFYNTMQYGLKNDPGYCSLVDYYNLAHPENIFDQMNFFTDYAKNGLVRIQVMREIGNDTMTQISKYMPINRFKSRRYDLHPEINMFFTKRVDLHIYHEIGKHFLCATQMYNHIPGHGVLKRKDLIVNSVDKYALRYEDKPQCFNKEMFFPFSYRLYRKDECKEFFNIINSEEYLQSLETEPIQYIIKIGYGAHRAKGVFLFDSKETAKLKKTYGAKGQKCGQVRRSMIAQTYVTNPLLLDMDNKFDFRIYMLVASTNPLIVFYHDGFLRVSLNTYDKFSRDRSTHLTNTHLSKKIFSKAQDGTVNGMTEAELRDYQMWTLEDLQEYLLDSKKITDKNWLNNYLRPTFQKAFIHTVRMSEKSFWKGSNVFEMFGLDFMLDDNLNLWFIECNSSPQLIGTNPYKTNFLIKMLKDLFEIQYSYYRSRMMRVFGVFKRMYKEIEENESVDYSKWKNEYKEAVKNRLEPQYEISKENEFVLIMDKNKQGADAYLGYLEEECADD